jgi:hypothetical protein
VLSVLLLSADSDYLFGIFTLFFNPEMIKKAPLNDITQSSAERLCNASVFKRYKTLLHLALYINFTIYKTYIDNVKTGSIITVLCEFEHAIKKRQKHKSYKQQK